MNIEFFSLKELFGGLLVGTLFGFFLRKGNVTRSSTIIGQLLLKDFTVMKVIMTAIATGSLWLFILKGSFASITINPIISSTTLLAALIGGGIFGLGMAMVGYCPGTCVGALAEKDKSAWFGFVGMLVGSAIYAEIFPKIQHFKPLKEINKSTLYDFFQISPWLIESLVLLAVATLLVIDLKSFYKSKTSTIKID